MYYKEHCKECQEKLGKPWCAVHRWLDEFAKKDLAIHRVYRHHKEGIEQVRKMWGDEAAEAARLHIMADEGRIPSEDEMNTLYQCHSSHIKGD
jgi:DNA-binding GntR family transcriptional regulator